MIMDVPKKSAAQLRADVYAFFLAADVSLTSDQKNGLSSLLKSVYEHRVIESRKADDAPIRHEIICPKCQGITIKVGRQFKNYKKRIKIAGGTVAGK